MLRGQAGLASGRLAALVTTEAASDPPVRTELTAPEGNTESSFHQLTDRRVLPFFQQMSTQMGLWSSATRW